MSLKVIAFALWGDKDSYFQGALANIKLASTYYPGWKCRIYCDVNVPIQHLNTLHEASFKVLLRRTAPNSHEGLFWRFEPAFDPSVEVFISRDCDSRLNPREAAAVNEWLASGRRLHTMRDHYEHIVPILGGMWGCRYWPEFKTILNSWPKNGKMGDDQDFLKDKIWPLVRENDSITHDLYTVDTCVPVPGGTFMYKPVSFFGEHEIRPFPAHAPLEACHGKHVGARV